MELCRIRSGLSYAALARAMGFHVDTVHASLRHPEKMRSSSFAAFCKATGADPSFLLYGDSPPPSLPLSGSTLPDRLRTFFHSHGLSLRRAASLCGLPSSSAVSAWTSGRSVPLVRQLLLIASGFGVNAAAFFPPQ
jgi:lambda repressor-like predicted transcriptional regulator